MLKTMSIDNIISLDLHASQLQALINKGFHNLYIVKYMAKYLKNIGINNDEFVFISPDVGSIKRTESYAKLFNMDYIVLHKRRNYNVPGTILESIIIGDKKQYLNKTGIIIDDIADTMNTMISATNELVKNGIKNVIIAVTHGILSDNAISKINNNDSILNVIVSNSLDQTENLRRCNKLMLLDCSELLSLAINGIINGKSISNLFEN